MITIGVDIGSISTKAVLLKDSAIAACKLVQSSDDISTSVDNIIKTLISSVGLKKEQIEKVAFTGVGRNLASVSGVALPDAKSGVAGIRFYNTELSGLIDVGAENAKVVKTDQNGRLIGIVSNDKCASGTGIFLDTMAKLLKIEKQEKYLNVETGDKVEILSPCVVFAESEVVSLIHKGANRFTLWLAINRSVANKVGTLVNKLRLEGTVGMIGGVARNPTFVDCMRDAIGDRIYIPPDPEFVNALGAAILVREQAI
jgi:predicted CoA-substrate-specific enzyme activase